MSKIHFLVFVVFFAGCGRQQDANTRFDAPVSLASNSQFAAVAIGSGTDNEVEQSEEPAVQQAVELANVTLHLHSDVMSVRCSDTDALVDYIDQLYSQTSDLFHVLDRTTAKGVVLGVGVRPDGERKIWCSVIDGELQPGVSDELALQLQAIEPCKVTQGPISFELVFSFDGNQVDTESSPQQWTEAMESLDDEAIIPDDLFAKIWKK